MRNMKNSKNAIILCSGGLDSVVTAYYVKDSLKYKNLMVLFFNYGQRSLNQERLASRYCAKKLMAKFLEIKINFLGKNNLNNLLVNKKLKVRRILRKELKNTKKESKKFYVPLRNSIFLMNAVLLTGKLNTNKIFVGFKNEGKESYPDTTEEFVSSFNNLIKVNKLKIKVIAPLIKKDKEDIILLGKKLGVNFEKTYSCYVGANDLNRKNNKKNEHCGTCLACRLRQEAFYWANVKDPTNYREKMRDFRFT